MASTLSSTFTGETAYGVFDRLKPERGAELDNDSEQSWLVSKSPPAFAEGLDGLADLDAGVRQGSAFGHLPIFAELFCAHPRLEIGKRVFTLGVTRAIVRIDIENGEIVDRFSGLRLQEADLVVATKKLIDAGLKNDVGGSLDVGGSFDNLRLGAKGNAKFGFSLGKSKSVRSSQQESIKPEISIISSNGLSGFAYGDFFFGDPRRPLNLLQDTYKCVASDSNDEVPLFTIRPFDRSAPVAVSLNVHIPTDRLWATVDGREGGRAPAEVVGEVGRRVEHLRGQLLAREIGERTRKAQILAGWRPRHGEFIVFSRTFEVTPSGAKND